MLAAQFQPIGVVIDVDGYPPEEIASDVLDIIGMSETVSDPEPRAVKEVSILFLRHGEPEHPLDHFPDYIGAALSRTGVAEARAARNAVQRFSSQAIYASDMRCASQTATIVSDGTAVERMRALRERILRGLSGVLVGDIPKDLAAAIEEGGIGCFEVPGEETLGEARARLYTFLEQLTGEPGFSRILWVSHGGPHTWLLERALGVDLTGNRNLILGTGRFSLFNVTKERVSVEYVNSLPQGVF